MSVPGTFYETQARICAQAAADTDLPMLREKYEQARAAWAALADRETTIREARDRRLAEQAAARADEGSLAAAATRL